MKKLLALGMLITTFLTGCATTTGTNPQTLISKFDGVKSVGIQAHGGACKDFTCPMLGATWLDNQPNNVGFSVKVTNLIANIHTVSFNIDGEIITINAISKTDFNQEFGLNYSSTVVVTNYSLLTKILQSKRTWMKVSTSKGAYEVAIIDGATDSKAFHALKRFDTQVKEASKN